MSVEAKGALQQFTRGTKEAAAAYAFLCVLLQPKRASRQRRKPLPTLPVNQQHHHRHLLLLPLLLLLLCASQGHLPQVQRWQTARGRPRRSTGPRSCSKANPQEPRLPAGATTAQPQQQGSKLHAAYTTNPVLSRWLLL